jgi:hypothetical protein
LLRSGSKPTCGNRFAWLLVVAVIGVGPALEACGVRAGALEAVPALTGSAQPL